MEQIPCNEFDANAMYFSIGMLTYNLNGGTEEFCHTGRYGKKHNRDIEMEAHAGTGMDS